MATEEIAALGRARLAVTAVGYAGLLGGPPVIGFVAQGVGPAWVPAPAAAAAHGPRRAPLSFCGVPTLGYFLHR